MPRPVVKVLRFFGGEADPNASAVGQSKDCENWGVPQNLGLHWDTGKPNGNYYLGFRVKGLGFMVSQKLRVLFWGSL